MHFYADMDVLMATALHPCCPEEDRPRQCGSRQGETRE